MWKVKNSKIAELNGERISIIPAIKQSNDQHRGWMFRRLQARLGSLSGKTIAILGLTFKPNTDDMRDAPALVIVPYLQQKGAIIRAFDPEGGKEAKKRLGLDLCADTYDALEGADGVAILTEWNEFRALDLERVKTLLKQPLMIDLRNIYRPEIMAAAGFSFVSVGRPKAL